jgi:TonB family protein
MIDRVRLLGGIVTLFLVALCAAPPSADAGAEPVRYDAQTMSQPKVIHKVTPTYPKEAKEEGVEGIVILDTVLTEEGVVRETRVVEGEDARLVDAARSAVGQWRYEPALDESGEPLAVIFTVTIRFMLGDK